MRAVALERDVDVLFCRRWRERYRIVWHRQTEVVIFASLDLVNRDVRRCRRYRSGIGILIIDRSHSYRRDTITKRTAPCCKGWAKVRAHPDSICGLARSLDDHIASLAHTERDNIRLVWYNGNCIARQYTSMPSRVNCSSPPKSLANTVSL